jgi:hypothetical protein
MTLCACSSPAPTPVKLQPTPAILSQESVHTMLSITHHTRKRPSTGPQTTHGPQILWLTIGWPLWPAGPLLGSSPPEYWRIFVDRPSLSSIVWLHSIFHWPLLLTPFDPFFKKNGVNITKSRFSSPNPHKGRLVLTKNSRPRRGEIQTNLCAPHQDGTQRETSNCLEASFKGNKHELMPGDASSALEMKEIKGALKASLTLNRNHFSTQT